MEDYIVNNAGAKIYHDIQKHEFLEIPVLDNASESGNVYNVLSVGFIGAQREPVASVKEPNGNVIAYRLPHELNGWIENAISMKMMGISLFPSKVEFGVLNDRVYVEML